MRTLAYTAAKDDAQRHARRGLAIYFAVLVPFSAVFETLMIVGGGSSWVAALMWTPGAASIIARLILREGFADVSFRLGGRRGAKAIVIAVLFPIVIGLISYGIAWTVGLAHFSPRPDALAAGFVGDSAPPIVVFVINLALAATVVAVFSARIAAGEEIGWRGYMLTRLIDAGVPRPGSRRAVFGQRSRCTRPGTASFRLRSTRRAQVPVRRCGSASRESSSCSP